MLRSILSILGGWGVVGVLVVLTDTLLGKVFPKEYVPGTMPPDHLAALSLATSTIYSVIGGWVTARIAPEKHWQHVMGLLVWGEVMGIASTAMTWGQIQPWYQLGLLVLWPVAVIIGGWIRIGKPRTQTADLM